MISKIRITTATAAYSSVLVIPLAAKLVSAALPSGPVTYEVRPFASDRVIARTESMAVAALFQP